MTSTHHSIVHRRAIIPLAIAMLCLGMGGLSREAAGQNVPPGPAPANAWPPELAALDAQYSKLQRERVTTPHETELAKLNDSYWEQLRETRNRELSFGRVEGQQAFADEHKRLQNKQPVPETDAQNTPRALVNLRTTYRAAKLRLDAKRAADQKVLADPLARRLTQMAADFARAGRVVDAKAVEDYRDALGKLLGNSGAAPTATAPTNVPATAANVPLVAATTVISEDRNIERVLEDVIFPEWQVQSISTRWDFLPKLQVRSDVPELTQHAEALFAKLCQESGLKPEAGERIIDVYIGRSEKMKELIAREEFKTRNESTCLVYWDERHALRRSAVFLSTNNFATKEGAKASLCRTMVHAFGLGGTSQELKVEDQSVFSQKYANVQSMSAFDCKLLTFVYGHIPPGTTKPDARRIIRKEWKP